MGLSAPGEMRLNLEESGVGSQKDQTVSTLFPPANTVSALRSHLLKKSDTSQVGDYSPMSFTYYASGERRDIGEKTPDGGEPFAGPGLCRDLSSDASHLRASSRGVGGALSKKSIELSGIEVSPSAGQREETSMSERPYQRDGAFVDHQSGGFTIEVNEYVSPVKDDEKVAEVKSDPSGIAGGVHIRSGGASLSKVEMGSGYDCRYCSRKFSSKLGLGIHQGRLHKKKMRSGYDCRYCSRKFSSKRGLGTHQGRLHKKDRQQAESAEIQAGRSAVNQNTATSLQCYPMQPVQDMQLPPWGILTIPHAPRRGFEEGMAGRIGHDPQPVAMFHSELSNYSPNSMSYPSTPMPSLNAPPCSAQQQLQGPSRVYPDPPKHLRTVLAPTATATIQWRSPPGKARGLHLPTPPMRSTFNNNSMTAGPPTTSRTFLQNVPPGLPCQSSQPSGEASVSRVQLQPDYVHPLYHQRHQQQSMAGQRDCHDPHPTAMFHSEFSNYSPNPTSYPSTLMPSVNALPGSTQQQPQGPSGVCPGPPQHLRTVLAPTATATIQWRSPPGKARGLHLPTPPMRSTFNNSSMAAGPPTTSRTFLQNVPPGLPCQSSQPSGEASVSRVELQSDHVRYSLYQQRHHHQPMSGHRGHDPQPIAMFHSELSNYSPNPMSCSSTSMPSLNAPPGPTQQQPQGPSRVYPDPPTDLRTVLAPTTTATIQSRSPLGEA